MAAAAIITLVARQAIPTATTGLAQTATNIANAATTAASAVSGAEQTVLSIKDAWSSPSNCIHSNYCRIPVAIIIAIGLFIIIGCCCCIKGCADCIACCCCRSSARSRERLRPPEAQAYAPTNYGYGQQPPPYQPSRAVGPGGGGGLFPMPERPKYDRLGDEEQGIKLADMSPKHAYIDGDSVLSEADAQKERDREREDRERDSESTPIVAAAAPSPMRLARAPTSPYSLHDGTRTPTAGYPYHGDEYNTPPPALLPGAGPGSGRASPIRRDYQPSPVHNAFADDPYSRPSGGGYFENAYDTSDHGGGGGGYRDDGYNNNYEQYYYENTRGGGPGGSRGGGYVV